MKKPRSSPKRTVRRPSATARALAEAQAARDAAVAASQAKDDFLAALSHELRTPLNPILMLASDEATNAELPEDVRGVFEAIRNCASLQARLIDDLLDLTRITHGRLPLNLENVDVHKVLREAVDIVGPEVAKKRLTVSVELRAKRSHVMADQVRLHQVFWNVLSNAARSAPAGGRITVETSDRPGDGELGIVITDSGVAIPSADEERIFEPFSQGKQRSGGLGLGLAISRQLVEKHGGTIRATSAGLASGARFEINFPAARGKAAVAAADRDNTVVMRPASTGAAAGQGHPEAGTLRVLLIEDHAATRETLNYLLGRRNIEVVTASSAAEARLYAKNLRFDIVISDLGLPDGDGCEVWAELKASRPKLIGIALSGYGMAEDIARSRAAGFTEHLTKPVDMNELDRAIAAAHAPRRNDQ